MSAPDAPPDEAALRAAYRALLAQAPGDRPGPDPADIVALAAGQGPLEARLRTLDRVMADPALVAQLELARATLAAAGEPPAATVPARRPRRLAVAGLLLAAGLAAIWLAPRRPAVGGDAELVRSTGAGALAPLSASRDGDGALQLAWPAAGADAAYVVELLDGRGAVVADTLTRLTTWRVPAARAVAATTWWVRLRDGGRASAVTPLPPGSGR